MNGEESMESRRVLVTGGAGFIGSHLCDALFERGYHVVCIDNLITGKIENINHLIDEPKFTFVKEDLRDISACHDAVKGCEFVFHQAALGSVPRSISDPIATNEINITGTLNILVAARDAGVSRFIYAASSSTYGDSVSLPKVEDSIGKPLSPYAITKYVNELYASVFSDLYGIKTIGLRYFNVFGPRQDPEGAYAAVIPKFVKSLIQHDAPKIYGDGEQSRDFTYVENVVQANLQCMTVEDERAFNQVYNVACGERTTLNELFQTLKAELSEFDEEISNIESIHVEPRIGDVRHSLASIEKGKELLGYQPEITPLLGIKKAINWYWENLR